MPMAIDTSQLNVLHVLTLNGRNGEYGGPVRVARELCSELNARGHTTQIFSGALRGSEPKPKPGLTESFVLVKPILRKLPVSTLWSWALLESLSKQIKRADVVHIHFARDLIPFLATAISILNRKPFVTQTHGMIISDGRLSTRLIDFLFTRRLINRSRVNLVLSDTELTAVLALEIKSPCRVLPNGIAVNLNENHRKAPTNRVAFCSRLEKRKGVGKFIELAYSFRNTGLKFEIYGPDGGELLFVQSEISSRNLTDNLEYKGSLQANEVQRVLAEIDVLVLPSKDEPFPMVILEALAVGTPVLVMPSCGFSRKLKSFDQNFVAHAEDYEGLHHSFKVLHQGKFLVDKRSEVQKFCNQIFGIAPVVDELESIYSEVAQYV